MLKEVKERRGNVSKRVLPYSDPLAFTSPYFADTNGVVPSFSLNAL